MSGSAVASPGFSSDTDKGITWRLRLFPRGTERRLEDSLSLYIHLYETNREKVDAEHMVCVVQANGERTFFKGPSLNSFTRGKGCGYEVFLKRNFLLQSADRFLPNDALTLHCQVRVFQPQDLVVENTGAVPLTIPMSEMWQNLEDLFESGKFSDVTFNVDGKEIPAHRSILAARSPVFAAMFEHDMREKAQRRVEVTDLDYETVLEMVRFIYLDYAPKVHRMAETLLVAADKYALDRLKAMCEEVLCADLAVETAARLLALAETYSASQLKEHAMSFITTNASYVMKTADWQQLVQDRQHLADWVARVSSKLHEPAEST